MSFTSSQFVHICPSLNEASFTILNPLQIYNYLKFLIQYCGYLGIKCLAVPFLPDHESALLDMLNRVILCLSI